MRKGAARTAATRVQTAEVDPRDREIERLRALVAELTRRNELLQEALRRVQGAEANR